jgi:hypothetical protein
MVLVLNVRLYGFKLLYLFGFIMERSPLLMRNILFIIIYSANGISGKIGSITADILSPLTFRLTESMSITFWIAVVINMIAFFFVLLLNCIDKSN